ncbi:protein tic 214 [Phtheirospermum japonicum]|uniref:Protein tic 214 n=1 Tax=Phtheirospermum japonicum TaxID=374723 RepID=A0A830C0X6_9LAMI|nr:protein tic 214 [Phtheirospermum japonicum]
MHKDNQFGRCGRTLLWISDHILHRALLSLPSPSSGYQKSCFAEAFVIVRVVDGQSQNVDRKRRMDRPRFP